MTITAKARALALRALARLYSPKWQAFERGMHLDLIAEGLGRAHIWNDDLLLAERENDESDRECLEMLQGRVRE